MTDTIAAIATAPGEAAVSILRISGPNAKNVVEKLAGEAVHRMSPRKATLLPLKDQDESAVDHALALWFPSPGSYTGEEVVELHCHGGVLVTRRVLELLLAAGARSAEPGEFTQRAFLNGKMDLTQAEAVMDLIHAQSELALRAANEQLDGSIGREAEAMRAELIDVLAHVEAYIDFPEEDIAPDVGEALKGRIQGVAERCDRLLATSEHGRILRHGARTVICGQPNVGKSSLLNLLLGFDRAIVNERAGTTRDTIEEIVQVHGFPLRLVDTAGLRQSADEIEQEGIQRSEREIERADLILEVVDGSKPMNEANRVPMNPAQESRRLLLLNKLDLGIHPSWGEVESIPLSCSTGAGVETLRVRIQTLLGQSGALNHSHPVAINARHKACFDQVRNGLRAAKEALEMGQETEFIALELREAMTALGDVTGRVDIEEVLDVIFSSFCIGK
ncbi:MAG: tRNA uridine-5-carboxymethylaminomethyl(34) synthesis GTPase MnmE [Verrucomicrobiaceae bacterium]|nr:tRNA uridine-5-carboxymethylaminomethyl(34) synthesis GTPase MnmE [Verrucomicrobiaceae bacterium]